MPVMGYIHTTLFIMQPTSHSNLETTSSNWQATDTFLHHSNICNILVVANFTCFKNVSEHACSKQVKLWYPFFSTILPRVQSETAQWKHFIHRTLKSCTNVHALFRRQIGHPPDIQLRISYHRCPKVTDLFRHTREYLFSNWDFLFEFHRSRIMFSRMFELQPEAIVCAASVYVVLHKFSDAVYFGNFS